MKLTIYTFFWLILFANVDGQQYDLTVVGPLGFDHSISLQSVSVLYRHRDNLKMNVKGWLYKSPHTGDIPPKILSIFNEKSTTPGRVAFYTGTLGSFSQYMLPNSPIKIALIMAEATRIPPAWIAKLNMSFDAIVVPDDWLIPVYKNCGLYVPIFSIPLSCFLDEFLDQPTKKKRNEIFRFGIASSILDAKNIFKLARAFAQEFTEDDKTELHIVGGTNPRKYDFQKFLNGLNAKQIIFYKSKVSRANYVGFIRSLDCYVMISKGEGFSITPREALAAGIPCILTNNTAQKVICQTGFVKSVHSDIITHSLSEWDIRQDRGFNFDCKIEDVQHALREVYENYDHYLALAQKGRTWVKRYTHQKLAKRYLSLFKPTKILFGETNEVTDEYFMTNSRALYNKYKYVFKK